MVLCWNRATSIHHTEIGNFCHDTGWAAAANCGHLVSEQLILTQRIARSVTQTLFSTLHATGVRPFIPLSKESKKHEIDLTAMHFFQHFSIDELR